MKTTTPSSRSRPALVGAACLLALVRGGGAATTPRAQVERLPGWPGATPTRHFTGLVESDPATGAHNFYYLVESQGDPAKDPLFIFMNGGPGASSLAGVFGENGPLLLTEEGSLIENPYAWNLHANVLAIEFAPGVGYSYCASTRTDGGPTFARERRQAQARRVLPVLGLGHVGRAAGGHGTGNAAGDDAVSRARRAAAVPSRRGSPSVYLPTLAQELLRGTTTLRSSTFSECGPRIRAPTTTRSLSGSTWASTLPTKRA